METQKSRNREKEIAKKNMILEKKNEMLMIELQASLDTAGMLMSSDDAHRERINMLVKKNKVIQEELTKLKIKAVQEKRILTETIYEQKAHYEKKI